MTYGSEMLKNLGNRFINMSNSEYNSLYNEAIQIEHSTEEFMKQLVIPVHAHPLIEFIIHPPKKDGDGEIYSLAALYNAEYGKNESEFFLDKALANDIILLMKEFIQKINIIESENINEMPKV